LKLNLKGEVRPSAATGRTVRLLLADCPPGWCGPSAWLVRKRCGTGHSRSNNGPSVLGRWTVRVPRGLSAGVSLTVRGGVADRPRVPRVWYPGQGMKTSRTPSHPPTRPKSSPFSLSCSLTKKRSPSWGFRLEHSPDRLSTSPDSPRGSPPYHSGIFFEFLILSLGF
jgi:hypothetical protein